MEEKEIKWKTRLLLLPICLCLFIFLTSCNSGRNSGIPDPPEPLPDLPSISDKLVARIYFDATLSMQGFVVPGSTHYTRICPALESAIVNGWRDETVSFFRFGERVEPIDRGTYLQAGYESFYEQEHIFRRTYIEEVIRHEEQLVKVQTVVSSTPEDTTEIDVNDTPEDTTDGITAKKPAEADNTENQLVVIVTDLFQDDSDITLLTNLLKEKCIKKGCEVGLFGLRSQFDGTVYDIGIGERSSLRYRSNPGDPKTFRPFYLLVLGRYADIAHYFNRLKANGFTEAQTIIFSQHLVNPLLSFEEEKVVPYNLNKIIVKQDHSRNPILKQYEIVRSSEPAKIIAKGMRYNPLPHAMPFDSNTFVVSTIAEHKPDRNGENERSVEAMNCLEVTPTFSENELTVEFALATSLPRRAVYLYEVTLNPAIDTYKVPEWCSRWDMGTGRNGARTLNLVNFVRGLTETTVREHLPKAAQFYFYIKKR